MSGRQIKRSGSEEGGRDGKRSHASADPESADDLDKDPDEIAKLSKEQLLAWKKEKRRKQNREAQRRRRDRLLCQQSRGMQPGAEKGGSSNESNNGSSQQVSRQAPSMGGAPAAVAPASGQQQQAWLPPQQHNFDLHRFVEMQSRQQSFSAPNLNVGDFHGMGALDGSNPGGSYPAPLLRNNSQNFGNFGNAAPLLRQMSLSQGGGGMPPLLAQNSFEAFAGGTWPPLLHQGSASFSQLGANGVGAVARQNSMPAFLQGMDPSAVAAAAAGGAHGAQIGTAGGQSQSGAPEGSGNADFAREGQHAPMLSQGLRQGSFTGAGGIPAHLLTQASFGKGQNAEQVGAAFAALAKQESFNWNLFQTPTLGPPGVPGQWPAALGNSMHNMAALMGRQDSFNAGTAGPGIFHNPFTNTMTGGMSGAATAGGGPAALPSFQNMHSGQTLPATLANLQAFGGSFGAVPGAGGGGADNPLAAAAAIAMAAGAGDVGPLPQPAGGGDAGSNRESGEGGGDGGAGQWAPTGAFQAMASRAPNGMPWQMPTDWSQQRNSAGATPAGTTGGSWVTDDRSLNLFPGRTTGAAPLPAAGGGQ